VKRPLLICALACSAAAGADEYPIKVYPCPRLSPAPKIDGDLSDASWKKAPLVSGFTYYNKPRLVDVQTSFRVGYDERCLYFAVHCDEAKPEKLTPSHAGRDSTECFHGETIEIFLDPNHDQANYYQFAVNLAGSFYDAVKSDPAWNSASVLKTKLVARGWVLEMAVPWRDLGVAAPGPGKVLGFNVCRDRHVGGARQWSNWSQTLANFHDPKRFAPLVLSPTDAMLGSLEGEFRKGGRGGPVRIFAREGRSGRAYLTMAREALSRLDALVEKIATQGKAEPLAPARAEVAARLETARRLVQPLRKRIGSGEPLGAAEWGRMSVQMAGLEKRLGELLWEARLAALLKEI
jgi:hypothetical protein